MTTIPNIKKNNCFTYLSVLVFTLFFQLKATATDCSQWRDTTMAFQELELIDSLISVDLDSSERRLEVFIGCFERPLKFKVQATMYKLMGDIQHIKQNNQIAIVNYTLAIEKSKKIGLDKNISDCYYKLGLVHSSDEDYFKADECYQKSLKFAKQINDLRLQTMCYLAMAYSYSRLFQLKESETYYLKALDLSIMDDNRINKIAIYLELALIKSKESDLASSNAYLQKAKATLIDTDADDLFATYYKQLASNTKGENLGLAKNYVLKAITYCKDDSYSNRFPEVALEAADIYFKAEVMDSVKYYLNWVKSFGIDRLNSQETVRYYNLLGEYHAYFGRYKKANYYTLLSTETKQGIVSEKNLKIIAQLKIRDEEAKKDKELLEKEILYNEQEKIFVTRRSNYINLVIFMFIILALVVTALLYRGSLKDAEFNQNLSKHNRLLKLKDLEKSKFIDSITHELRTPLYTISGLIELLRNTESKKEIYEYLNTLSFSSNYLSNFIDNMISINAYKQSLRLEKQKFDLRSLVQNIINSIKIIGTTNRIHLFVDNSIPNELIGDPLKLSQVLFNLANNANKFTEHGKISIVISVEEKLDSTIKLIFEISDTGIGIEEANHHKVFNEFYVGEKISGPGYDGTGIGLSVVKNIVELHGGTISLKSKLGVGTTFTFDMALDLASDSTEVREAHPDSYMRKPHIVKPKMDMKIKVLLVEDNKINQMIVSKILQKNNIDCQVADNGKIAVNMVANDTFDLILMDYVMPEMDGLTAIQKIRTFNKEVLIFALSGISKRKHLDELIEAGAAKIIPKPIEPSKLVEVITQSQSISRHI